MAFRHAFFPDSYTQITNVSLTKSPEARVSIALAVFKNARKEALLMSFSIDLDGGKELPSVKSMALKKPPKAPEAGVAYIVPAASSGEWSGKGGQVARYSPDNKANGGWLFTTADQGLPMFVEETGKYMVFNGVSWAVMSNAFDARVFNKYFSIERLEAVGVNPYAAAYEYLQTRDEFKGAEYC